MTAIQDLLLNLLFMRGFNLKNCHCYSQGLIFHEYDGPFIYAEVNGTKKHWKRVSRNPEKWEELLSEPAAIGKKMSTKHVGSNSREDITSQYKYPEGLFSSLKKCNWRYSADSR